MEAIIDLKNYESPGEVIRNYLEIKGWTQDDFAQILSLSTKHINELVKDKRPLSLELVTNIAMALEFSEDRLAEFAEMNTKFQLHSISKDKEIENKAHLYRLLPIGEMIKKGWMEGYSDFDRLFSEVTKKFGFTSTNLLDLEQELNANIDNLRISYRNTSIKSLSPSEVNRIAWCLYAKHQARFIEDIPSYNKQKLESLLNNISIYTCYSNIEDGIIEFLKELNNAGVRFLLLSHLQKTYTEGAAFNFDFGPVIVLTARTNRLDTFWFNMAHEIIHILLEHNTQGAMIDGDETLSRNSETPHEKEANEEASRVLKSLEIHTYFKKFSKYIPENEVLQFAKKYQIHPSIIAGRLAWEGITSYSIIHRFKDTIKDKIPNNYIFDKVIH